MPRYLLGADGELVRLTERTPATIAEPPTVKTGAAVAVDADAKGNVVARIAQLGVIDLDRDVTTTGCIGSGQDVVISSWQHGSWQPGQLPVGKGRITEEQGWLVLRGRFFLSTFAGGETYKTLRELAGNEWSYGFSIQDSEPGQFEGQRVRFLRQLAIHEAAPVLRGAGINTATVELSNLDPTQLQLAALFRENEAQLRRLRRGKGRRFVGFHNGDPVYSR